MKKTIIAKLSTLLIVTCFLLSNSSSQAQMPCVGCTSGSITSFSYTTGVGTFNVTYKDCGSTIEIISITCNGASVSGSLLFTAAITFFFNNKPNVQTIEIPATCVKWVVVSWVHTGNSMNSVSLATCPQSVGCCIFDRSGAGMLDPNVDAPMCDIDCWEACQGR